MSLRVILDGIDDFQNGESKTQTARNKLLELCTDYLPLEALKIATPIEAIKVTKLSGGSSNLILRLDLPASHDISPDTPGRNVSNSATVDVVSVVCRVYTVPPSEDELIAVALLSERGFSARLYAAFEDGRLEEYIESRTPSRFDIMKDGLAEQIAGLFGRLHQLSMPISKRSKMIEQDLIGYVDYLEKHNAEPIVFNDPRNSGSTSRMTIEKLRQETTLVRQAAAASGSPVLFCHNDLNHANVLLPSQQSSRSDESLMFIDYEFAGYNYRGFDLADHLGEYMFDLEYDQFPGFQFISEAFPSTQHQATFCRHYLSAFHNNPQSASESAVAALLEEIRVFHPIIQFYWAVWTWYRHLVSFDPQFSHKDHAAQRLHQYFRLKHMMTDSASIEGTC
jgi:thiamine kinase-like enzyme